MEVLPHETELIATIAVGLSAAFIGGLIAYRFRLPPLVGYLLAGVAVGPFTPGFVADTDLAPQLAEIGVILLMFGVGIHFSIGDLLAVRRIALPGAIGPDRRRHRARLRPRPALGLGLGAGLVFGLALSVASTVVLLRALEARRLLEIRAGPRRGRLARGRGPGHGARARAAAGAGAASLGGTERSGAESDASSLWRTLLITLGKVAAFVALMLVGRACGVDPLAARAGGRRPARASCSRSPCSPSPSASPSARRELFGVSFALGAFFAGVSSANRS